MKIKEITIKNFRGIKNIQTIPLSNFSSIVGKNDSGKSIVLHAIASFLDSKDYPIVESDFNNNSQPIIIECTIYKSGLNEIIEKKLKSKFKKDDGLDEFLADIIFENTIKIQKQYKQAGKTYSEVNILIKNFDGVDFINLYKKSDEELKIILDKLSITVPTSGVGRNSKLEKIKFIKKYCIDNAITTKNIWIDDEYKISDILPAVELFASDYGLEADTKFKTNSVAEIQDFFNEETKESTSRLSIIEKDIKDKMTKEAESIKNYMLDYTSSLQKIEISPFVAWKDAVKSVDVSFQFEDDEKPIQMSHKGAGYRRLFMVARFRYLAEKNKGKNIVYLIEEPETFLHPSAQNDLLFSFNELSNDNQIIITTHSPVFAGSTNYKSIILCKKENQSVYETAPEDEKEKNIFIQKIVKELGIKPHYNLVDNFSNILFVESNNDINFYDVICNKILKNTLKGNDKILCLPFGGENIDSFVNIDYFEKSGRKLFLILDSDKHNTEEKQKQQQERKDDFDKKENGSAYLLKKSCIENYYHPRAIERNYNLTENSLVIFEDNENVKETIKKICEEKNIQIKTKNNFEIYNCMTENEWTELVEEDLLKFLRNILDIREA